MEKNKIVRIITVSAVIFIVLLLIALVMNLVTLTRLNNRKAELESKLTEIREQIEANNAEIDYISSDEYIDAYAREYLNMKGKDEEAFTGKEK
ncbi:MAG TPA: hypothetical protein DIV38_00550 [Clostridiales bacterium]|nr:hypothetical protein [Clostridiales bacterium]